MLRNEIRPLRGGSRIRRDGGVLGPGSPRTTFRPHGGECRYSVSASSRCNLAASAWLGVVTGYRRPSTLVTYLPLVRVVSILRPVVVVVLMGSPLGVPHFDLQIIDDPMLACKQNPELFSRFFGVPFQGGVAGDFASPLGGEGGVAGNGPGFREVSAASGVSLSGVVVATTVGGNRIVR